MDRLQQAHVGHEERGTQLLCAARALTGGTNTPMVELTLAMVTSARSRNLVRGAALTGEGAGAGAKGLACFATEAARGAL